MRTLIEHVGNPNGHFKNKHNRARKLIDQWGELADKFERFVERADGKTNHARCALATLVMMDTGIRIGNEDSAEGYKCINKHSENFDKIVQTYGLTTLQVKHVSFKPRTLTVRFNFMGKKQVENFFDVADRIIFRYMTELVKGKSEDDLLFDVTQYDLTKFIKRYVGRKFSPKDLRTAKVNLLFNKNLQHWEIKYPEKITKKFVKALVKEVIAKTAEEIGHTPGVCKSAYLSPTLVDKFKATLEEGKL